MRFTELFLHLLDAWECKKKEEIMIFAGDFGQLARANTNFRKVLHTGPNMQVVAMSLRSQEDIGRETHPHVDQLFVVASGAGEAEVGGDLCRIDEDDMVLVPAGALHNIINTGDKDLKLLTIYSSPQHAYDEVQRTKRGTVWA